MGRALGNTVIAQVLDAGFNLDFIDADAVDSVGIPYKVLILPGVERLPVATYEKVVAFVRGGGIVIATRRLPASAPGFLHHHVESNRIRELSETLFHGSLPTAHLVTNEATLGDALRRWLTPDVSVTPRSPGIGFFHRRLNRADLYFLANTSSTAQQITAHFRAAHRYAELLDAFTGQSSPLPSASTLSLHFAPYESRLILFTDDRTDGRTALEYVTASTTEVSSGWQLAFEGSSAPAVHLPALTSWTTLPRLASVSARGIYMNSLTLSPDGLERGTRYFLNFGDGTPIPVPSPLPRFNMRAYLDSPIRDAAQVFINGTSAGYVWHPPFEVDITTLLHPGVNDLRIVVGNSAINEVAAQPLPDYRLLNARYGLRFVPQEMDNLRPLPSGLVRTVTLVERRPVR